MVSSWVSRTPKLLVCAGLFAVTFGVFAARPAVIAANATDNFYPAPCTKAPTNLVIHYKGATSGCTDTNNKPCTPGELVEFTASSSNYTFQLCDTFTWTFGDDQSHPQVTLWPTMTRIFNGTNPRTVSLKVANSFASTGVSAQAVSVPQGSSAACSASANVLCFGSNRFQVTLDAIDNTTTRASSGNATRGEALPETQDTGSFTLKDFTNDTSNPEVVIKVFDFGGQPLMLFGALTDTEVFANVLDTQTGNTYQLHKPAGTSNGGFALGNSGQQPTESCPSPAVPATTTTVAPSTCTPNATTLCLNNNRFAISVKATDPNDHVVFDANTRPKNSLFGFFYFPKTGGPTNLEVFSKVVGPLGNVYLIFYGGLTNLEYRITFTDTVTGKSQTYLKPAGSACGGFNAFSF